MAVASGMQWGPPQHLNVWSDKQTWFWYGDEGYEPRDQDFVFDPPLQSWRRESWPCGLVTSSGQFPGLSGTSPPAPDILDLAPEAAEDVAFVEELAGMLRTPSAESGEMPSLEVVTASEGDEGVFPFLLRWQRSSAADAPASEDSADASAGATLNAEQFMSAIGLNPAIAEESRRYIEVKTTRYTSTDGLKEARRRLLHNNIETEFYYGKCTGPEEVWKTINHQPAPKFALPASEGHATVNSGSAAPAQCAEEAQVHEQSTAVWLPILRRLCNHVQGGRVLVLTCGGQRLLNPIPMFAVGLSPSGDVVGLITGLVFT